MVVPLDLHLASSSSSLAPRERTEGPCDSVKVAFEVFRIAPEGATLDVIELSSGSGSSLSVCGTHGRSVGSRLSLAACLTSTTRPDERMQVFGFLEAGASLS